MQRCVRKTDLTVRRPCKSVIALSPVNNGHAPQGDRRAGPSLTAFNYESRWGQLALKTTYRAIMEEEGLPVIPPCCRPTPTGPPPMTLHHFLGQVGLRTSQTAVNELLPINPAP